MALSVIEQKTVPLCPFYKGLFSFLCHDSISDGDGGPSCRTLSNSCRLVREHESPLRLTPTESVLCPADEVSEKKKKPYRLYKLRPFLLKSAV